MGHKGRLEMFMGDTGSGKDSAIYWTIHNRPFVLIQLVPNNETMDDMFFLRDSDKGIEKAKKILRDTYKPEGYIFRDNGVDYSIYHFAIWCRKGQKEFNPKIWEIMDKAPTLWLGEINYWGDLSEYDRKNDFVAWCRDIRGRDQLVLGSTHRSRADVPPIIYEYARKLHWVGKFSGTPTQAKELYDKTHGRFDSFEEFDEKIRRLVKFNALKPNPEESILTIKDLEV